MDETEDIELCRGYFDTLALTMGREWGHTLGCVRCLRSDVDVIVKACNDLVSRYLEENETCSRRDLTAWKKGVEPVCFLSWLLVCDCCGMLMMILCRKALLMMWLRKGQQAFYRQLFRIRTKLLRWRVSPAAAGTSP